MIQLTVNNERVSIDAPPDTPLLWALREKLNLTGTKYGCGIAQCGACTVHLDGQPTRACVMPLSAAAGKSVTTVEGLMKTGAGKALEQAWNQAQAPQCGYCQSGQLMVAAALLAKTPKPTDDQIAEAMLNICRCGTYNRVRAGIKMAAGIAPAGAAASASAVIHAQEPKA